MSRDVSPELVLVDPTLGDHARTQLADPKDTLARVDALIQASRLASLARLSMEEPTRRAPHVIRTARRISTIEQSKSVLLAGATVAGMLVIALVVGVHVDLSGTPAGADTTVIDEVAVPLLPQAPNPGAGSHPRAGRSPRQPNQPEPQRFAWAPVRGVSAYHIELFRGSSKVFEADTRQPAITIPARWAFGGRTRSLQPGDYRWNVWPVFSGGRAARAIVQAKLAIPSR